ncbi:phospholipid-transporting ATPase IK [Psammomys obesus]|uniref:phospholipid-transporting ATPase IK n=1 Tax=Psammomys obesus TaxID=48139 RepID=UPI00245320DA|nr:phospholipid-transporting ATPase IK [Psammomys obesus]
MAPPTRPDPTHMPPLAERLLQAPPPANAPPPSPRCPFLAGWHQANIGGPGRRWRPALGSPAPPSRALPGEHLRSRAVHPGHSPTNMEDDHLEGDVEDKDTGDGEVPGALFPEATRWRWRLLLAEPQQLRPPAFPSAEFTWEVKANDSAYHKQCKKKGFLCWRQKKYKSNAIHTAKYNFFSFLPLNLYEQFSRVSNLYFLFIIILQSIPEISTLPWFTLFAPLICLLTIRATRDLVDDIGRHRSDKVINNRPCQILRGKSFLWKKWKNLYVGDVVRLRKDNIVPADMLLLASTEPSSLCYVETADIDGETNLKFRQALTVTHLELTSPKKMASFHGVVTCEEPNSRMHHFVGSLEWNSRRYPLGIGNLLLRGCRIRNTDTCYGLVIYAGLDTKIMKNCGKIHLKRTKLDLLINKFIILIFMSLVLTSLLLTMGFTFIMKELKDKHFYLSVLFTRSEATESFFIFWGFLILLSVIVPMSMFIIAEFIYLGNSFFINWDLSMYYEPRDMPAKARSTSLNDQLGQVQYIFSDKTGTLTQNIMTFKKCCINGCIYDDERATLLKQNPYSWNLFADGKFQFYNKDLEFAVRGQLDRVVQEFWRLLAICHTVMVQEKDSAWVALPRKPRLARLATVQTVTFGYEAPVCPPLLGALVPGDGTLRTPGEWGEGLKPFNCEGSPEVASRDLGVLPAPARLWGTRSPRPPAALGSRLPRPLRPAAPR